MAVRADESAFVKKLMEILGMDPNTTVGFELRCYAKEIVTVKQAVSLRPT